ncbi:MAG: hypothetical protein AVDCRST_MAG45-2498, partial [uncultured Solirubrobacterales bacterium]
DELEFRAGPHRGGVSSPAHDGDLGARPLQGCPRSDRVGSRRSAVDHLRGDDRRPQAVDGRGRSRRAPAKRRLLRRRARADDQLSRAGLGAHGRHALQGADGPDHPRCDPAGDSGRRLSRPVGDALLGRRREPRHDASDRLRSDDDPQPSRLRRLVAGRDARRRRGGEQRDRPHARRRGDQRRGHAHGGRGCGDLLPARAAHRSAGRKPRRGRL